MSGEVGGPYKVGTVPAGFVSGYFGLIPAEWQGALGGPVLNGHCCLSIISRTSYGPAAFAIDPTQLGTIDPVPISPLVYYPNEHQTLGEWGADSTVFNGTTTSARRSRRAHAVCCSSAAPSARGHGTGTSNPSLAVAPRVMGVFVYDLAEQPKADTGIPMPTTCGLRCGRSAGSQERCASALGCHAADPKLNLPFANAAQMILGAAYDPQSGRICVAGVW